MRGFVNYNIASVEYFTDPMDPAPSDCIWIVPGTYEKVEKTMQIT